ncbi:MAG: efflux RND transporter periplasmic adaptor subunit [bacterium]|nr:MAG: efflux RND transporter periplasmic adaptor subunit [bacterium]
MDQDIARMDSQPTGRKRSLRQFLWLPLTLLAVVGLSLFLRAADTQDSPESAKTDISPSPGLLVETAPAEIMPANREISAVGTLHSNEAVVIAAEIAGRVTEISFTEGERVRAGKVLARLDSSVLQAQRDRADASLVLSRANRDRADVLLKDEAISQREWDEAYAQWRLDEADLRLAEAQLAKTVIEAPFDGVLGLRHVSVGEYVQPGIAIVTLDDTDPIKVDFRVPETFIGGLEVGQTVQVEVDAMPDRTFTGLVYAIDPKVDVNGRNLLVRARISNRDRSLRPGMFAHVNLVIEENPTALMVPEPAIISRGRDQLVYKVVEGRVVEAQVTIGMRRRGLVEIVEGLEAGDIVITAGQIKVRPGMPVTVAPAGEGN